MTALVLAVVVPAASRTPPWLVHPADVDHHLRHPAVVMTTTTMSLDVSPVLAVATILHPPSTTDMVEVRLPGALALLLALEDGT